MPEAMQLDRTYHYILETLVARGQAPHYTEIAKEFAVTPSEGKRMLHDLMATRLPNWLHPNTDLIASFAPFNNLPTHYRVTVDGEQKWFAQCGLEAVAISWLFPGKTVEVEAPCLSSGDPLRVAMRDGVIEREDPADLCLYFNIPFRKWRDNLPFA
jgi:hypothetical protein